MAKLRSTFPNMVIVLAVTAALAGAALGYTHQLTEQPIRLAQKAKQEASIRKVAPAFDNAPAEEKIVRTLDDNSTIYIYPAKQGGEWVGAAVESFSKNGFGGQIDIMVGFEKDGTIRDYTVLKHAETPGLGSKMETWFHQDKNRQSVIGKNPASVRMSVSKDGGEIDAITAATISSRAFLEAIQRAYNAYMNQNNDAVSGASPVVKENPGDKPQKEEAHNHE